MKRIIALLLAVTLSLSAADTAVDSNTSSQSTISAKELAWGAFVAVSIPVVLVGSVVYYITLIPLIPFALASDN